MVRTILSIETAKQFQIIMLIKVKTNELPLVQGIKNYIFQDHYIVHDSVNSILIHNLYWERYHPKKNTYLATRDSMVIGKEQGKRNIYGVTDKRDLTRAR